MIAPNEVGDADWQKASSSTGVCINIRGRRYNYVNDGEYNSLFEEYLTPYSLTTYNFKYGILTFKIKNFFDKYSPNKEKPIKITLEGYAGGPDYSGLDLYLLRIDYYNESSISNISFTLLAVQVG